MGRLVSSPGRTSNTSRSSRLRPRLRAPRGIEASTFSVGERSYVLFEFPLPQSNVPQGLTLAERHVVQAVLVGRSNREIASARGTSLSTVSNQLRGIYRKLGVARRVGLIEKCAGGVAKSRRRK